MSEMKKLILIDGNSLINRAFYALPPLNNSDGVPVNAVYGFTTMLIKAIGDYKPDYMAVAFDMSAPTFRHKMYGEYKAGRRRMPDDLASQLPLLKQMLSLMNVKCLELQTYEADDIIGTLSRRYPVHTIILTGDRDSLQLIDENTEVYLTKKGLTEISACDATNLKEKFGLQPWQIVDYKGLAGDSSDNIPGVSGVGEKTALDLLQKYNSLDGVYENVENISGKLKERLIQSKEVAYLSKKLGTIDCNVPIECEIEDLTYSFPFSEKVKRFFIDMSFKSLYKKEEIFACGADEPEPVNSQKNYNKVTISAMSELLSVCSRKCEMLAYCEDSAAIIHFSFDGDTEYVISGERLLFDLGISQAEARAALKSFFEQSQTKVLLFDAKKTLHKLHAENIKLSNYEDLRLMQFLIEQNKDAEDVCVYLQELGLSTECCASELWNLYAQLCKKMDDTKVSELYRNVELPLIEVLFDMEKTGVLTDADVIKQIGKKLRAESMLYTEKVYELAGEHFNINSPKQLSAVLFEKLAIPYPKKGKKISTNAEILEELRAEYPIADYVLKYRLATKLLGTYIDGLQKLIDVDGRVHTEYKQMLTSTGRLSSVEPNMQNIPVRDEEGRELRAIFIAGEGKKLISADYSQIELRLMAHFSQDPTMLEIYRQGGDIHAMTASRVFGVELSDVTEDMRRRAKAVNFGIIYGMSDYGLSESIHCSVKDAKRFIERYFEHFPRVKEFVEKTIEQAKQTGEVRTLLGRRRTVPELLSSNFMTRSFGARVAVNTPLQGSAADIIKIAMISVYEKLKETGAKLILQIHDELIVESPDENVEQVREILVQCMENALLLSLPLTVEVESGKSWLDC